MTVFDLTIDQLRARESLKWRAYPDDVLPAWVAEMDCVPAEPVRRRLHAAIETGDTGYPVGNAYQQALRAYAEAHWDWSFDVDAASVIVPDVMLGIVAVLHHFTADDAAVVINPPVYPQFYKYLAYAGRPVLDVPLTADGRLDLEALERAFAGELGPKPEAYLLCSPHNPHGTVHTRDELARVAELAAEHDVLVISDEIHAPLVSAPARHTPFLAVDGVRNAVIVTSASKSWNLAGLKAGVAVASPDLAGRLLELPDQVTHSASHLGIIAHTTALREGQPWLTEALAEIEANRALLVDLLAAHLPGARYRPQAGTYLAWVDCSALGLDDPQKAFLTRGKVALNSGAEFGPGGQQCVRVNLATSPEILTEVVRRMRAALD
ncbi:MalY/PatB family protein [Mariniluteicoccus flavus]